MLLSSSRSSVVELTMLPVDRRHPSDLLFCLRWAGPVLSHCRLHFQKIQDMDYMTHDTYYTTRRLQYLGLVFIYFVVNFLRRYFNPFQSVLSLPLHVHLSLCKNT